MLDKKSIVILYSKGENDTAALATAQALKADYKDVYVIDIDDQSISPWRAATLAHKSYVFSERNATFFNDTASRWRNLTAHIGIAKSKKDYKEHKKPTEGFKKWIYSIKSKYARVYNVLARYEPDVVLCTTPKLMAKANKAKYNLAQFNCSVAALITDYTLDKQFVHFKTDVYFVQNELINKQLIEQGIDKDAISVIGTPVEDIATQVFDKAETMTELGIEDAVRQNIVLVGGRYGSANIKNIIARFIDGVEDYNLIILTGGSSSLQHFAEVIAKSNKEIENIYFVEKIDAMSKLYTIADVIIAKPTAQITYEAMLYGKPLILTKGSTANEKANAHYLASKGVALHGKTPDEAVASLVQYLEDKEFTNNLMNKQYAATSPNDAVNLAQQLYKLMQLHYNNKLEVEKKRRQIMSDDPKYAANLDNAIEHNMSEESDSTVSEKEAITDGDAAEKE